MEHIMKLQEKYYNYILNGTKRIEIRLYDEKRKKIKIGDTIKFLKEPKHEEYFQARVIGLLIYQTLEEMLKDYDISILADKTMTKDDLKGVLEQFYSKDEQQKYGIIGIKIKLL